MSFLEPETLTKRQKIAALTAIVLMLPVVLDAIEVIDLGDFRMAPFFLLLIATPFTWVSREGNRE